MNIPEHVLKRRVFKKEVNDRLMATTIMGLLDPYVDKDKISIDVGAAAGHFTYYLAPRSEGVLSLEPSPSFAELKKMGDMFDNVLVEQVAIGCRNEANAVFWVDDKRLSNSGFQNLVNGQKISVMTWTLDTLGFGIGIPVGFIKVDVEGTELDVLQGAYGLIYKWRPNLMVEIYKPYSATPIDAVFDHLMAEDYNCFYCINGPKPELVEVKSVEDGVDAVENLHHLHDGDFLFVS